MWIYEQTNGHLWRNGKQVATGYSGFGAGKNNPVMESVKGVGPIPVGLWFIGRATSSPASGPVTIKLQPGFDTETYARSGFEIHGDSKEHAGCASHGCIILPHEAREQIVKSDELALTVLGGTERWDKLPAVDPELGL